MNVFTYKVEKDNTGFGWRGETPAFEDVMPSCIIPTNCVKKARAFVRKWALKNGFIAFNNMYVKPDNYSVSVRTNF